MCEYYDCETNAVHISFPPPYHLATTVCGAGCRRSLTACCHLTATKDLAQTSYFLATNRLGNFSVLPTLLSLCCYLSVYML